MNLPCRHAGSGNHALRGARDDDHAMAEQARQLCCTAPAHVGCFPGGGMVDGHDASRSAGEPHGDDFFEGNGIPAIVEIYHARFGRANQACEGKHPLGGMRRGGLQHRLVCFRLHTLIVAPCHRLGLSLEVGRPAGRTFRERVAPWRYRLPCAPCLPPWPPCRAPDSHAAIACLFSLSLPGFSNCHI